jgi:hypothetical protein
MAGCFRQGSQHDAAMAHDDAKPPLEWMQHLHAAGQWQRLEEIARERLAADPQDADAHFHRAWALLRLGRSKEMGPHAEHLLREDAECLQYLQLAALWHLEAKRWRPAQEHLDAALRLYPEEPVLWQMAAGLAAGRRQLARARECAARARQLAPDDADIAHLDIALASTERTGAAGAWATVREYERALALEPENDTLLGSMGDVYLEELEMPARAEELYRQALALAPADREHQQRLWNAMQARNLLFRTLRLPISGVRMVRNICRGLLVKPWYALLFLVGFKFVALFLVWLVLAWIVFAPPAWAVEWLVVADIRRASRAADSLGGWWLRFHRLPFAVRLALCLGLILGFWWGIFAWLDVPAAQGFKFIGIFFAINLALLTVRILLRRQEANRGRHAISSAPRSIGPPSLPRPAGLPPPLPPPLPKV